MRGKGVRSDRSERSTWDHPRLCGEKVPVVDQLREVRGSPPPMRGKGPVVQHPRPVSGITPAYAGKREAC